MNRVYDPITIAGSLLVCGLLTLAVSGCGQADVMADGNGAEASAARVEAILVPIIDLTEDVEVAGSVEGFETANLYAKVGGYLAKIDVDLGDTVKRGDILAQLYIPEVLEQLKQKQALKKQVEASQRRAAAAIAEATSQVTSATAILAEAKAALKEKQALMHKAEADFKRLSELTGSVRQELVDAAKFALDATNAAIDTASARVDSAQSKVAAATAHQTTAEEEQSVVDAGLEVVDAEVAYAETMSKYAYIVAPFDGAVTKRMADPGDFIQSADGNSAAKPVLQVARVDHVRVRLDVPMSRVALLDVKDAVVLDRLTVLPDESFPGEVSRFSAGLNPASRMMRVEVDLPNAEGKLRPGYYGYVTITLSKLEDSPVVPSSALVIAGGDKYVFVVEGDMVRKRVVTVNYEDGNVVGIASGLKQGERVVRSGGGQLSDGQKVDSKDAMWIPRGS